jgi:MoaA/NifB/PqqE/SkfB family radical SAM enzyme
MAGHSFVRRVDYVRRHARVVGPYLTPRKLANAALNEAECRCARARPRSLPPYIKLEATPLCHLSCPGCVHKSKEYKKTLNNKMHLTVERFGQIIDPIAQDLIGVSLSLLGEPLLNRELPEIVDYAHRRRVCTSFPTNMSVPLSAAQAEAFVNAGLDLMQVSLDGASEETYLKYRIGGRFPLVLENVRTMAEAKRRLGAARPILVWKMVIFPHNKHEVEVVKRTYSTLGFDRCEFVLDYCGDASLKQHSTWQNSMVTNREPCYWAWNTAIVGWDGTVSPCCKDGMSRIFLGNAAEHGLKAVWQDEPYAALRRGFRRDHYGESMNPVCRRCVGLSTERQTPRALVPRPTAQAATSRIRPT